jgi:hypothetical protein
MKNSIKSALSILGVIFESFLFKLVELCCVLFLCSFSLSLLVWGRWEMKWKERYDDRQPPPRQRILS